MARSMTGFGHAVVSKDGRELSIELKSVNHRFLDLALRMPRSLAFLEDTARNTLGTMLARGHVDIFANYRNTRNDSKKVEINMPMLSAYMTAARQAAEELGIENDLTLSRALRLTDIVSVTEANQNFSRVTRIAETNGQAVIFKNNRPKYMLVDLDNSPLIDMTDDEKIDFVAARILKKYKPAFMELAK